MAKILYTVCGVGLGHASRASILIKELQKKHEVKIVSYGDAVEFLKKEFSGVQEISWFELYYKKEKLSKTKTIAFNLPKAPFVFSGNLLKLKKIIEEFRPDAIISDFDVFGIYAGKLFNIPTILISNLHAEKFIEMKFELSERIEKKFTDDVLVNLFPKPNYTIVSSIEKPEKKRKNTFFYYTIVNPEIMQIKAKEKDYFLAYFSEKTLEKILPLLEKFPGKKFIVYGKNREIKYKNFEFRKFSKK
ncbi:MAG: glycosyltransferase family protein, partial [Candidatus Diapherotrites archaeon]